MKKSFCRNMIKLTSIEEKRYWNFPSQFFSGWDESQSVGNVPYVSGKCVAELNLSYFLTEAIDSSLRSCRYCVIKVLAAEPRSKKRSGDEAFLSRLHQISLDWYSGSAAKSHSTSTQYRQLRRLLWGGWGGCCAEPLSWNYVLITLSRCKFHFENRIFRCFLSPSTSMPLWNSPQCFLFFFLCNLITSFKVLSCLD